MSDSKISRRYFSGSNNGFGRGLQMPATGSAAWAITPGAARDSGGNVGLLTQLLTRSATGREHRAAATQAVRQYLEHALSVNEVRLSEAAALSKERIIAEGTQQSAELKLIIQRVADQFIAAVDDQFSRGQQAEGERGSAHLRALDESLAAGRMTPEMHAERRAAIEQIYQQGLGLSATVVNDLLQTALDRIRSAIKPREDRS